VAQAGSRYVADVIGRSVRIEQVGTAAFELSVDGGSRGRFSSAQLAREHLVSEIQTQIGTAASASEVPALSAWRIENDDPGEGQ